MAQRSGFAQGHTAAKVAELRLKLRSESVLLEFTLLCLQQCSFTHQVRHWTLSSSDIRILQYLVSTRCIHGLIQDGCIANLTRREVFFLVLLNCYFLLVMMV